jgi:hypothetical protein
VDQIEYQLLAQVAAGDGALEPGEHADPYLSARLLQLRARGLVRFADQEGYEAGPAAVA